MDQGSNRKRSAAHNFAPTVTKFCVMWEGLSLPRDTQFGKCRGEIVNRRMIFIWTLIHGSGWSGLIKAEPGKLIDTGPCSVTAGRTAGTAGSARSGSWVVIALNLEKLHVMELIGLDAGTVVPFFEVITHGSFRCGDIPLVTSPTWLWGTVSPILEILSFKWSSILPFAFWIEDNVTGHQNDCRVLIYVYILNHCD